MLKGLSSLQFLIIKLEEAAAEAQNACQSTGSSEEQRESDVIDVDIYVYTYNVYTYIIYNIIQQKYMVHVTCCACCVIKCW